MARIRSIKPEFWLDRKLARSLTRDERMLYLGLWNQADEWGRAQADARLIHGQVFPYEDDIGPSDIDKMLDSLERVGVVILYEHDGDPYLFLPKLAKHQRLEPGKVPSRHPEPPEREPDQQTLDFPDESARRSDSSEPGSDSSEPGSDSSGPRADSSGLLYGAGSRGQGITTSSSGKPPDKRAPTGNGPPPRFEEFWAAYPRREAKRKAELAYRAALKRAPAQTILDGLARFDFAEERKFIPLPATWLNADRWADEAAPTRSRSRTSIPSWELQSR